MLIVSIKRHFSQFLEKQAARKRQDDFEEQQVQALMEQHGWSYQRAHAVFLNHNGLWDCD